MCLLDAGHALISNVSISTHPVLNLRKNFRLDIPPSPTSCQQSVTINLPSTYHVLAVIPTVVSSSLQRQTQLTVTLGMQKLAPAAAPMRVMNSTKPMYEVRLAMGITKIEIEMIAGPARGMPKFALPHGPEVDYERLTVYINLLRT